MSENNKSYRIRTNVGSEYNGDLRLNVNLLQDYNEFEILSLKIGTENLYKYHTSHYGCIVGRVLANGGVGIPNVKVSSFIPVEDIDTTDPVFSFLYPYSSTRDKNRDDIRYNLLTDTKLDDCHQPIGTFPNKRLVLDDNNVIEIYDKYYKFTTTTNGSGDYMLFGLPVGNNIIHSDLDLSDIGILSQKPRDMFYKGYTAKQFENASQFKKDTNLDNLTQVITQDSSVYVFPFWGDEIENEGQIKIVRHDIDVNYKFEPTCIFIGCIVSDEKSNAISKNCIPHERMGKMDRLTTGAGTIEMIRKTVSGDIESISIQGNDLIDGNGTWCYQIPMNLDYVSTDEYGNLVPTDDYNKGLPTRTSVRFRVSLADYESDYENAHLVKVLVPNNPVNITTKTVRLLDKNVDIDYLDCDYEFGSATQDTSFRDMFWNNVYTVKSYIPRFQKGNRQRNKNFTGFKAVNVNGANNPIPYNNMRINLTFLFIFQCLIFKSLVLIVKTLNKLIYILNQLSCGGGCGVSEFTCGGEEGLVYLTLDGGMCPTLNGDYIAPGANTSNLYEIITHTYNNVIGDSYTIKFNTEGDGTFNVPDVTTDKGTSTTSDPKSADGKNGNLEQEQSINKISDRHDVDDIGPDDDPEKTEPVKIYNEEDYFVKCVELQFAMEYEVIQFDFYNDWINGMIYIPRWFAEIKKNKDNMYYCGYTFTGSRRLTQQCALGYDKQGKVVDSNKFPVGCRDGKQQCHQRWGRKRVNVFGANRGIVKAHKNSRGQYAYYLRPGEVTKRWDNIKVKTNLFPTDIVLLGSVLDCNQYGIPKVKGYTSSSYKMPPPTAEIVSDTQEMEFGTSTEVDEKTAYRAAISYLNGLNNRTVKKYLTTTYWNGVCANRGSNCSILPVCSDTAIGHINYIKDGKYNTYNVSILDKLGEFTPIGIKFDEYAVSKYKNDIDIIINNFKNSTTIWTDAIDVDFIPELKEAIRNNVEYAQKYYKTLLKVEGQIYDRFYLYFKEPVLENQLDGESEPSYTEMSGIDWGYNPFDVGDEDHTEEMKNQIAGHFLEIGCTFSLSNIKSCVNLQRVCEIGGEISQSHYYLTGNTWDMLSPTGIIAKREVSDAGIRTTFATLNSQRLSVTYDKENGYKKYKFTPYNPVSFMGDLGNREEISNLKKRSSNLTKSYGLIEDQSLSYRAFRLGTTIDDVSSKFLINKGGVYFMPQYDNSFYFYFGLKDGNTAIDRLYTEYYAPCDIDDKTPEVAFVVEEDYTVGNDDYRFIVHYSTKNMGYIKWASVKERGILPLEEDKWYIDVKKSIIKIKDENAYSITLKDNRGRIVKGIIECKHLPEQTTKSLGVISYSKSYDFTKKKTKISWVSSGIKIKSVTGSGIESSSISDSKLSGTFLLYSTCKLCKVSFIKESDNSTAAELTIYGFGDVAVPDISSDIINTDIITNVKN